MIWGVEETALAGLGALFLLGLALSAHPRMSLSLASRLALALAAGGYLAAAIEASSNGSNVGPHLVWMLPVAPLVVAIIVTRDMMKSGTARRVQFTSPDATDPGNRPPGTDLQRRRAADPATPATELADLAYAEPDLRESIAANPSTPSSVLAWLAALGDDAVLRAIAARGTGRAAGRAQ